jgi:D-serine deaminase-like pyridoxal phosphate-dependent protein
LISSGVTLSIIVDDVEVARQWSEAMTGAGVKLRVLVKVDVGFHRCGIDPDSPHATDAIKTISELSGLSLRGLLSHAGHSYGAGSGHELAGIADKEIEILRTLAAKARDAGVEISELSVGSDADRTVHCATERRHRNAPRQLRVLRPDAGGPGCDAGVRDARCR